MLSTGLEAIDGGVSLYSLGIPTSVSITSVGEGCGWVFSRATRTAGLNVTCIAGLNRLLTALSVLQTNAAISGSSCLVSGDVSGPLVNKLMLDTSMVDLCLEVSVH